MAKIERMNMNKVHEPLLDISTLGVERWGSTVYRIAVRGACEDDRPIPHIHIFLNSDVNPFLLFTFEVSIVDVLCKNEINLIYQYDKARNVCHKDISECSWTGYEEIREGLTDFLFRPYKKGMSNEFSDNLNKGIYCWNSETDFNKTKEGTNVLRLYFEEKELIPLPQFLKYLEDY